MTDHINRWESTIFMDGCCVVGVIAIPYPIFGVIINIVSKEFIAYHVKIGNIPHCTHVDITNMSSYALESKGKWVNCKHNFEVLKYLCKVDYDNDEFIHAPT